MASIKAGSITLASALAEGTRVVLLDAATGNTILNTTMDELVTYLSPLLGGGGGAGDSTPDSFSFTPVTNAQLSIDLNISNTITVAGINLPVTITTTTNMPYRKNGGAFTTADGIVVAGDEIEVRLQSSDFALTEVSGVLTIGGVAGTFSVTTGDFLTPISALGQQVHRAWFQEDLNDGEVTTWVSRGRLATNATQSSSANRPVKLPDAGGVYFQSGLSKWLQFANDQEAVWSNRWWIAIARANLTSGSNTPVVCRINGDGSNQTTRQPSIVFSNTNNTMLSQIYDTTSRSLSGACDTAFTDWNVLIGWRRGFKHLARVNAGTTQTADFNGWRPNNLSSVCTIGDNLAAAGSDLAIDSIIFGDGELTDYQVEVLEAWALWRVGRQAKLVTGLNGSAHPFVSSAPLNSDFDSGDRTSLWAWDQSEWDAYEATSGAVRLAHRGEATYSETGYKRVFFTDFDLADQKPVSDLTGAYNSPWFAPGWVGNLGLEANIEVGSSGQPQAAAYVQDTGATAGGSGRPGTISLHLFHNGNSWNTGTMYTINKGGQGRWWGKGIFKSRMKYTSTGSPGLASAPWPSLFPAPLWSYVWEHMFYRTRNRVECDFWEQTGKSSAYSEGNTHIHEGIIDWTGDSTISSANDEFQRAFGHEIKTSVDPDYAGTLNIFDGNFHEYICRIDDTDVIWWIDAEEICRMPSATWWRKEKYLIANIAKDAAHGDRVPATTETFDMVFDYIEVMQLATEVDDVPTGFSGRPTIAGTATQGQTLTVTPNTIGTQIEYRWYRDGVPIVTPTGSSYVLAAADVGHKIFVHVKNKSLVNQPEAWTADTATIS